MKLYHVYTINPLGEKHVEHTYDNGDDAEFFLAQIDDALNPSWDAGIDEQIVKEQPRELAPIIFEYFKWEEIDVQFTDAATGEPLMEPIWEPIPIPRNEFLQELKAGNRKLLDVVCHNQEALFSNHRSDDDIDTDLPF